jgi:hypothetical protein
MFVIPLENHSSVTKSASIPDLLTELPGLKPGDIKSCTYTVEESTKSVGIPSPHDTQIVLTGSAALSQTCAKALKSGYEWKPMRRADVPARLSAIMPPGDVLVSTKLNEGFENVSTYRHGFIAVLASDQNRIYFLATDFEHSIEE